MSRGEYSRISAGLPLDFSPFLYPGEPGFDLGVGKDWRVFVEAFDTARVGGIGSAISAPRVGDDGLDFVLFVLFFLDKIKSLGKLFFLLIGLSVSKAPPVIIVETSAIASASEESPVSDSTEEIGGRKVNFSLVLMCNTSRGACSFKDVCSVQHYVQNQTQGCAASGCCGECWLEWGNLLMCWRLRLNEWCCTGKITVLYSCYSHDRILRP